jgi:hypothetical protein
MSLPTITAHSDNIIYLDFDGTITGIRGSQVINTPLCNNLAVADTPEKRSQYKKDYLESDDAVKITKEAVVFLNRMTKLHPSVQIVIISRNYENYIRGLLEFEGIDTANITIYPRGEGNKLGPGEDKRQAVTNHEQSHKPGLRFVCDDDESDYLEMIHGAKSEENTVIGHHASAGQFKWLDFIKEIIQKLQHVLPISEYLNGRTTNRFHLFKANVNSVSSSPESHAAFKQKYQGIEGDDLKRAILNNLKADISGLDKPALETFRQEFLKSLEYKLISTGQGLTTRVFGLQTDSQRAVELIFNKQAALLETGLAQKL